MADDRKSNGTGPGRGPESLPPPAFPPGHHRIRVRPDSRVAADAPLDDGVPEDAFISPDEPMVREGTRMAEGAIIPPEESSLSGGEFVDDAEIDGDQGIVTGIGDNPRLDPEELALSQGADPTVADLAQRVRRLADALRDKGKAGLRATPEMSRFEVTLRAYCLGYLAAQEESRSE